MLCSEETERPNPSPTEDCEDMRLVLHGARKEGLSGLDRAHAGRMKSRLWGEGQAEGGCPREKGLWGTYQLDL